MRVQILDAGGGEWSDHPWHGADISTLIPARLDALTHHSLGAKYRLPVVSVDVVTAPDGPGFVRIQCGPASAGPIRDKECDHEWFA